MKRLIEKTVFSGLVTAWRRASRPTRRSPAGLTATTDGVSRSPSALGITVGSPPSMAAITELVVPRSMPIVRAMSPSLRARRRLPLLGRRRSPGGRRSRRGLADLDLRGPQHAAVQLVAAPVHPRADRAPAGDGLVPVR